MSLAETRTFDKTLPEIFDRIINFIILLIGGKQECCINIRISTLGLTQMIIRGRGEDGGGGIVDGKAGLPRLYWRRIGSEEGGIDDLHPITLMAGQRSWNLVKGLLVD